MTLRALARRTASDLLAIGAVLLRPEDPFIWASGLRAPVYCDNRLVMGDPAVRRRVAEGLEALVQDAGWAASVIAGTATAGIPHAAWLAERMDRPMVYVRSSAKGHGRRNQVEGRLEEGARVVLVEDLVSTGGSSLEAVEALREAGAHVEGVVALFTYGLPVAARNFDDAGVPLRTLTHFDVLLETAREEDRVDADAVTLLEAWRRDPQAWSEQY